MAERRQSLGRCNALPALDLRAKDGPRADIRVRGATSVNKGFLKSGHLPTLLAAFLYFDLSFMVWVLLGPLGVADRQGPSPVRRRRRA